MRNLLLAAALLAAGCASAATSGAKPAEAPDGRRPSEAEAGEGPVLPGQGKAGLYQRIRSWTDQWAAANAEPGGAAAQEAKALETAIAREVWGHFDEVLGDLRDASNPRWRASAARGLGFVANPRVRPALEAALADSDPAVTAAALVSLGRAADVGTDDAGVARLLAHPDRVVRGDAALCLARVFSARRRQSLPPLEPADRAGRVEADLASLLFDGEDPILRANAAQALGALASPGAEEALLNRLRDEHSLVRLKTAQALARAGSGKSVEPLLDALGIEGEKNVRTVLALALGAVAEREGRAPPYADLGTDAGKWRRWLAR